MKKLTLKEMTESEQREVNAALGSARKELGRPLTNAEQNKIKNQAIEKVMSARKKLISTTKRTRKTNSSLVSNETFSWSASVRARPPR